MNALVVTSFALLVAQGQVPGLGFITGKKQIENPIVSKQKEKDELVAKLRRDIFKVDRSVNETERLIAKSRNAPYLPDLQFRLAELYVEKSRYVYYLQAETRADAAKGAMVSPETKLLKQKAIQIYNRILKENPDFKDGDKVTFYLAHEQRELGEFDTMLKTEAELIKKYPTSPLRLDAEQILGDYYFDKIDQTDHLKVAEEHYRAILDAPPSPVHDLARYKMGWIRINQNNHADAVTFFEAAAASAPIPGVDAKKALNVKREALLDLVYSYTEARPAKGAIQYFEKLSESRGTFALALDKLGNRYFIKQQYEYAIPALRKLMEIQPDPELDAERAGKLYDSLKASKGKVAPKPEDVRVLVRGAIEAKVNPAIDEPTRKKQLAELEEMGRDLATMIHTEATKKDPSAEAADLSREVKKLDPKLKQHYLEAAEAYRVYLGLFRPKKYVVDMMKNRANALYAAGEYPKAARQFEELAQYVDGKDAKLHEDALNGALVAHFQSLKPGAVEDLNAFEVSDARQALKLLGATFISRYAKSENVLPVKFNIARAYYEDGEFERSAELFKAFALGHPTAKDAVVAGDLALDSLRQINDFKGLEATARAFLGSSLPASFLAEVQKILTQSKTEALGELALKSANETGDVVEGLLKVADENKGQEIGEKALYGAFSAAREKRDLRKERELGTKFLAEYPKSSYATDVLLTEGRHAAESGRFDEAAQWYEQTGQRMSGESTGTDAYLAAAKLRTALGQNDRAVKNLETAVDTTGGARKVEMMVELARTRLKLRENARARSIAEQVLRMDKTNSAAAAIIAEVQATTGGGEKIEPLTATLTAIVNSPNGQNEDTAKALWYLGEMMYKQYRAIPASDVEQKVGALQQLQGVYTQAASMGSPEWAVASLWKLGMSFQHIAEVVEATPMPAGLKPSEVDQFRNAVKGQVEPLKQQAENAFNACLTRADQLDVFSPAVIGCRKKTDDARSPLPAPPPERPAQVEELLRKVETTQDAASMEALGLAYLAAHNLGMAQLALGRATEMEDTRAAAHNGLGVALLLSGDAMSARAEYGRALQADPTFEKARANIAALHCRYGDPDGAKRELGVVKDPGALTGPDVDPDWKACK